MQYRRFGRTELQMPVFSTGGMRYQDTPDKPLAEVDPAKQANLEATIRRSIELGINHIETARGYGCSERQLGVILPTLPRDQIIVQTKIVPEEDADQFRAHFDESLERLQLDRVDLLGMHGINNAQTLDWAVRPGGCLQVARELQAQGKIGHIGFSTHGGCDEICQAIETDAYGGFDYVNLHYYYIYRRNWKAVLAATRRDMGVFIISPSDKGGMLYNPTPELTRACGELHPLVFNDLWCLRHPEIHTLSLGASCPSDYDLHMDAMGLWDRADELVPPADARLKAAMKEATGLEHPEDTSWDGVPEHYGCPNGLNIPIMLWLYNLARGWGMDEYGKMRFNLLGNAGHWFPGCKPTLLDDTPDHEILAAVKDSPIADQIPGLLRAGADRLGGEEVKRLTES